MNNANSCVIHITGAYHSVLLTGDIGVKEEKALIASDPGLKADMVVAAHHGSRSSSSEEFIRHFDARHTVIQSGYLNRFNHPDEIVLKRWRKQGAQIWRTDHHGAINIFSSQQSLRVASQRQAVRRYWHH